MEEIQLYDKTFKKFLPFEDLKKAISQIGQQINETHRNEDVLFIGILNGGFMFAADLLREIDFQCYLSFLKLHSYEADTSSGDVKKLIGINEKIEGRTVIILEDIVDTGATIDYIISFMKKHHSPAKIKVATLLYKPEAYKKPYPVDYYGIKIPNKFVIGYGLDYAGLGRNYKDIYQLDE